MSSKKDKEIKCQLGLSIDLTKKSESANLYIYQLQEVNKWTCCSNDDFAAYYNERVALDGYFCLPPVESGKIVKKKFDTLQ